LSFTSFIINNILILLITIIIFYTFVIKYLPWKNLPFFLYLRSVDSPIPKYSAAFMLPANIFSVFASISVIFTDKDFVIFILLIVSTVWVFPKKEVPKPWRNFLF